MNDSQRPPGPKRRPAAKPAGHPTTRPASIPSAAPDPLHPERYERRVLLCVGGLTPSVVTETLYALLKQPQPFVPTEVRIITTSRGRQRVLDDLIDPVKGQFHRFVRDYGAEIKRVTGGVCIAFDHEHIHVIEKDGVPVVDIEGPEDSTAAGDTVISVVRTLAWDKNCAIHASIAGGRKSMSFLFGYAMCLLGRPQDRLSHVLVNEDFEIPTFYYPPPEPVDLEFKGRSVNTADARVTLAGVPLLRVFEGLGRRVGDQGYSFEQVVQLCQDEMHASPIVVKPAEHLISIGRTSCRLTSAAMFLYLLLAVRRRDRVIEDGIRPDKVGAVVVRKAGAIGFSGPIHQSAARRIPDLDAAKRGPPEPTAIQEMVSRSNATLRETFGPLVATRACIVGPGREDRDGHYGLLQADPSDILIV